MINKLYMKDGSEHDAEAGLRGHAVSRGAGWLHQNLAVAAVWVSQTLGGRVAVHGLADLTAARTIIIFPVHHYTGNLHQETHPISP